MYENRETEPAEGSYQQSGGREGGAERGQREARARGGRGFRPHRRVCAFCADKVDTIDYKQVQVLEHYLTERGKIRSRRKTGACARHQRRLALAIKRARHLALLPFTAGIARGTG